MATQNVDIDLSFDKHPGTNDIFKIKDEAAVRQSLRNILMSKTFDKPFDPAYGLNLNGVMFENMHPGFKVMLKKKVEEMVFRYEDRVSVDDVVIDVNEDQNEVVITLMYYVVGIPDVQTLNISVERTR